MASYMNAVDVFRAVVPRAETIAKWPDLPENNFIDGLVFKKLRKLNVLPSETVRRRRLPAPRLSRRHRHAADRRTKPGASWRTSAPTAAPGWSMNCWTGRSSPTTGR